MPRALALAIVLASATSAPALTLLTAGKVGRFESAAGRLPSAFVRVGSERALRHVDPICPTTSSLRFALSRRGADFEDHGEIALACRGWRPSRSGFRWVPRTGAAGGIREIRLGRRGLVIRAGGMDFAPIAGPVAYVEAWLTVGDERYLVRLQNFRRNDAEAVVSRRPSRPAAAGEAAFWDTVWADDPRPDEALRLLQRAVKRDPNDGRSQFLLGMLRLYRSSTACADFDFAHLCDAAKTEGLAAVEPLDRAVPLLANDTRIAGFRAAATYAAGYVQGDADRLARGLGLIDEAVAANTLFNAFDLFAVVAPVEPGMGDYYQTRVLPLVDAIFSGDNLSCPVTLPEICSNAGMAPHNFEGTLILLGDIYAKGGRLANASLWYSIARGTGRTTGYRYQAIAEERVATAADRVARYEDDDPTNDPPLLGGGGGSCKYCHNK
jgi:tetratricopeptide (TPR) repeat protein